MYGTLANKSAEQESQDRLEKTYQRQEDQRKLRAKRERERKSREKSRKAGLNEALHQAATRSRWGN